MFGSVETPIDPQLTPGDTRDVLIVAAGQCRDQCREINTNWSKHLELLTQCIAREQKIIPGNPGFRIIFIDNLNLNLGYGYNLTERFPGMTVNPSPPFLFCPMFGLIKGQLWNETFHPTPEYSRYTEVKWQYLNFREDIKTISMFGTDQIIDRTKSVTYPLIISGRAKLRGEESSKGMVHDWIDALLEYLRPYNTTIYRNHAIKELIHERGPAFSMSPFWIGSTSGFFPEAQPRYIESASYHYLIEEIAKYESTPFRQLGSDVLFGYFKQHGITEYFHPEYSTEKLIAILVRFMEYRRDRYRIRMA